MYNITSTSAQSQVSSHVWPTRFSSWRSYGPAPFQGRTPLLTQSFTTTRFPEEFFLSKFEHVWSLNLCFFKRSKIALLFFFLNRNCLNICGGIISAHRKRFSNLQPSSIESSLKMINPTSLQFPRCFASWFLRISFARCHQMTGKGFTVSFELFLF